MSTERYWRVKMLFEQAFELPRAERADFLRRECGDDTDLRAEVDEMLAFEDSAPEFLETATAAGELVASARPPERLGPFRILRLLGEGGMGAVYEAEQDRPRRRVALKVLHAGGGTPEQLRRFELESEVLGRLEHPAIARIYEVGVHDTGHGLQPWFAMELVDGVALGVHCRQRALPLAGRLELVARIADAVQHAHQRGIVHRDLKPANVLVDAVGQPKVLDFGIARATGVELHATLRTDPGMIIGTLQYMSPEQAKADPDVDLRADVYALGVMLYELVGGRPPHDLARQPMHEALRRVLEVEPPPLQSLVRVPADVAVITHKALEKDKERRYAGAGEFAADLRRFLRREPITAQAPSPWYRLQRFTARNKALVGGAVATFLALVVGLGIALWQRNEAREALARAEGINSFLLSDLLAAPSPDRLGPDVRVVDVLGPAARSAERRFANEPRVAAEVLDTVGASYRALGLLPEAEAVTRRALDLLGVGTVDRLSLRARGHLVPVLTELDRADEALELGAAVVADSARLLGADDPETLDRRVDLARARREAGDPERSIAELREVAADQARVLGDEDGRTLASQSDLAVALASSGELVEGQALLRRTLDAMKRALGPEHPSTLTARSHLGWMLTMSSDWVAAEQIYTGTLPAFESGYGTDHPYTARIRIDMSQCLIHLDRVADGEVLVRRACRDLEARLGADHAWTTDAHLMLSEILFRKGEHAAAIREASEVVERRRARSDGEDLGHALAKLGRGYQEAGEARNAAATFAEAAAVYRRAFGKPTDYLAQVLYNQGVAARDAGDPGAAIAPLQEALQIDIDQWGRDHRHVAADRFNLARTLLQADQPAEALRQMLIAVPLAEALGFDRARVLSYRVLLGQAQVATHRDADAERTLLEVIASCKDLGEPDSDPARLARAGLVVVYERQGRGDEAARYRDR